ncbi:MAG: DUF1467 family protein [Alphaproteobacteria bacterium]|nr:DUF1467 family protein [Alphaproteobacteria bacterium]
MSWPSAIVTFVIIWWCVFFMALPWGNRAPDNPEIGHADSAPVKPRLWLKAGITTAVAVVLWAIAYYIIDSGLWSFREMVRT